MDANDERKRNHDIDRGEAIAIARELCHEEAWPWHEPASARRWPLIGDWRVASSGDEQGRRSWVIVSRATGDVLETGAFCIGRDEALRIGKAAMVDRPDDNLEVKPSKLFTERASWTVSWLGGIPGWRVVIDATSGEVLHVWHGLR